jgi:hypothetical protein
MLIKSRRSPNPHICSDPIAFVISLSIIPRNVRGLCFPSVFYCLLTGRGGAAHQAYLDVMDIVGGEMDCLMVVGAPGAGRFLSYYLLDDISARKRGELRGTIRGEVPIS